jgi:hypothetical protein
MTGTWIIKVDDRIYGPFPSERMRSFAIEGRLAPNSLIAPDGSADWREAREEPAFREIFTSPREGVPEAPPRPSSRASDSPATALPNADPPKGHVAQFAIVFDMKTHTSERVEQAILALGPAHRLLPNVWIVATDQTIKAVRNRLLPELGKSDSLFVVDASRGKASWFNFGPEADVRIRRIWQEAG